MNTQFKTLFTVAVAHSYYSGTCRDVRFVVPADTAALLGGGRLLAKEREGTFRVLYEADDAGKPRVPISGGTARLGLRIANAAFANFTEVSSGFASRYRLYRNAGDPAVLDDAREVQPVGQAFDHALADSARPVTVTLSDSAGQVLASEEVGAGDPRSAVSFDLAGRPPGAYTVTEQYPAEVTQAVCYFDSELARSGIFGVLEIRIGDGFYSVAPDFRIPFAAREERLNYYVVAGNYSDSDLSQLSVADGGFLDDGRAQILFDKIPSSSFGDGEISPASLSASSVPVVLFRSRDNVRRTEKARRKIQLKKNGDVLIPQLPQPGPESVNADLIIPISKP